MRSRVLSLLLLSTVVSITAALACGRSDSGGGGGSGGSTAAPAAPAVTPPRFTPQLQATSLPPSLRWVRFGDTTVAHAKAHFPGTNLFMNEMADTSMGGTREQKIYSGPNKGRPYIRLHVGRSTTVAGYVGELGENYGSVTFIFGTLPNRPAPVLLELEVSQLEAGTPSVCDVITPLAANPAATNCPPNYSYRPGVNTQGATACGGDEEGQIQMAYRCGSGGGGTRLASYVLAAETAPADLAPPAPLPQ